MNILFPTITQISSLEERGIYTDLLREFIKNGHHVTVITPEANPVKSPLVVPHPLAAIIHVKTDTYFSSNPFRKALSMMSTQRRFWKAIRKHVIWKIDLILYATPPISFNKLVRKAKGLYHARTYLLLKDIFPQNAVDLGMLSYHSWKAPILWSFRLQEKVLYRISDFIGCMSMANVSYLLEHNPFIEKDKVEVCPNSIEPKIAIHSPKNEVDVRNIYQLPLDKCIFVYGGNLGKPQSIPFLMNCINESQSIEDAFFLIVGSGTEKSFIEQYIQEHKLRNLRYIPKLSKSDFDTLLSCCDVGLLVLDYRFTIPNYPSRILSYMENSIPILAATDNSTDIGVHIIENNFGLAGKSNNIVDFVKNVKTLLDYEQRVVLGSNALNFLLKYFHVKDSYCTIMSHFTEGKPHV